MKRGLVFFLVMSVALTVSGCKKVPHTESDTPVGRAFNAIHSERRRIKGYDADCALYDPSGDTLVLSARPDLDCAALFEIIGEAVGDDEINAIHMYEGYDKKSGRYVPVDALLEAFSLHSANPVKRLGLKTPVLTDEDAERARLWRDSLERLDNVAEVAWSFSSESALSFDFLRTIAEGGAIRVPFDTVVLPATVYSEAAVIDLSGIGALSGLKRVVLDIDTRGGCGRYPLSVEGLEALDPAQTQIDIGTFRGKLEAAEFADRFRALGFTVTGVSENPRDDLDESDAAKYDANAAERQQAESDRQAVAAFLADDMDFSMRLERYLELAPRASGSDLTDMGIRLLQDFYALAGTDEFTAAAERLCSHDERLSELIRYNLQREPVAVRNLHECVLSGVCLDLAGQDGFDRFLTDVVDRLPNPGDWIKATIRATDSEGNSRDATAFSALMQGYEYLLPSGNKPTLSDAQESALLDRVDSRGLLWGYHNARYFTGDAQQDFAMASKLLDEGRVDYEAAFGMMLFAAGDSADAFLQVTTLWDTAYDGMIVEQYASASNLAIDDAKFDLSRFAPPEPRAYSGAVKARKALLAIEDRETGKLFFPASAYRWFIGEDGERFRAIPAPNTPASVDEAELLIIARISGYQYVGEYTDGTKGYRCVSDVCVYDIATGECVGHPGTVYTEPASSLAAGKRYDVYPNPNRLEVFRLVGNWLSEG